MKIKFQHNQILSALCITMVSLCFSGCKDFVDVPLPVNAIAGDAAFTNDRSTSALLNNIYGSMAGGGSSGYFSHSSGLGFVTGLYTDEIVPVSGNTSFTPYFTDQIDPNGGTLSQWSNYYKQIYNANSVISGVRASTSLLYKNQWLGEALFVRAYMYFCLTSLFGDVPLALSTDYQTNNTLSRAPQAEVYKQIIIDLTEAQSLLTDEYKNFNGATTADRVRPNKAAATGLLARIYLYTKDWENAEKQASALISSATYDLPALTEVFLANSKETIWSLALPSPVLEQDYLVYNNNNPTGNLANIGTLVSAVLSSSLYNSFESDDARALNWSRTVTSSTAPGVNFHLMTKYKSSVYAAENIVLMRLAEQYLIRAEARAEQDDFLNALSDLNEVRSRAGLDPAAVTMKTDLLAAILHERRVELFAEQGHRFFDLRRTGNLDAVMNAIAAQKNASWAGYRQFWPIPNQEMLSNPNLRQTTGY